LSRRQSERRTAPPPPAKATVVPIWVYEPPWLSATLLWVKDAPFQLDQATTMHDAAPGSVANEQAGDADPAVVEMLSLGLVIATD
jgi:hypothetical protein